MGEGVGLMVEDRGHGGPNFQGVFQGGIINEQFYQSKTK